MKETEGSPFRGPISESAFFQRFSLKSEGAPSFHSRGINRPDPPTFWGSNGTPVGGGGPTQKILRGPTQKILKYPARHGVENRRNLEIFIASIPHPRVGLVGYSPPAERFLSRPQASTRRTGRQRRRRRSRIRRRWRGRSGTC